MTEQNQAHDPATLEYARVPAALPRRPAALAGIGVSSVTAGAVFGLLTNAVNGAVSPTYFVHVMGWYWVTDVWRASMVQGILEGAVVGLIFAVVSMTTIGVVTGCRCTYRAGVRWLGWMMLAILGAWLLGGTAAMALAAVAPEYYRATFIGVPGDHAGMMCYAWVGGSIVGAELGGFCVIAAGLVWFAIRWNRRLRRVAAGEAVAES